MNFADFSDQVLENWSFWTIERRRDFCCCSKSLILRYWVWALQGPLLCDCVCVLRLFLPFFAECGEMVTQFLGLLQYKHHFRRIHQSVYARANLIEVSCLASQSKKSRLFLCVILFLFLGIMKWICVIKHDACCIIHH